MECTTEADAFAPDVIRAAFVAEAAPYLRAFRPLDGLCTLLEEAARRRLDGLTLDAVVEQLAQLDAAALLALARHLRTRLAPGGDIPTPAVAERIVRMSAEELQELGRGLRERLAAESVEA